MTEGKRPDPPLWISEKDDRDQPVEQQVIDAAHRIWRRVLDHVRASGWDSSDAAEILEGVAHSVSRAIRRKSEGDTVRKIDAYLYWSFVREYATRKRKELRIQYMGSLDPLKSLQSDEMVWVSWLEDEILLEELTGHMDVKTRRMFVLRVFGYTWAEIGQEFGISAHNAEVQFAYGLKKARRRLFGRRFSIQPKKGQARRS